MFALFSRSSAVVAGICLTAMLGLLVLCGFAIHGLNHSADHAEAITNDEVVTVTVTAGLAVAVDQAYSSGLELALGGTDATSTGQLYNEQIPDVEARLAELRGVHESDEVEELRDIQLLVDQWSALRGALNGDRDAASDGVPDAQALRGAHGALSRHIEDLVDREQVDARSRKDASAATVGLAMTQILLTAGVVAVVLTGLGVIGSRRLRREIEPVQDAAEFADALQLAEGEAEAHRLLQLRILQVVPDCDATVLNRNNSADRLEPMTVLPPGSDLAGRLAQTEPRACLAIRSARMHEEDPRRESLMTCKLCAPCPGFSTCSPLTVGGEVIGSVLVTGSTPSDERERRLVRDAVAQAAPVLANLRNLAIAELRAATDALTGLPNKRAVSDNLKRMFAQASRTASPMALLVLDLDHFKTFNDRYGHPVGDQVLASVGAALRSNLREADFAGRNGGEEFAVIIPDTDIAGAIVAAEKLRLAISEITVPGLDLALTTSVGVAVYPDHALSPERLERLADAALYVAKRSGRNRVEVAADTPDAPKQQSTPTAQDRSSGDSNGSAIATRGSALT
jgi:diguanylate cyclase (GGDEF)-like protein